jgi:hypothetical protein
LTLSSIDGQSEMAQVDMTAEGTFGGDLRAGTITALSEDYILHLLQKYRDNEKNFVQGQDDATDFSPLVEPTIDECSSSHETESYIGVCRVFSNGYSTSR